MELIESIIESLNTKANVEWKNHTSTLAFGVFLFKDKTFVITIEKKKIPGFNELLGEVAFYNYNEETDSAHYDKLDIFTGSDALKIFSIVVNAVEDKFNEYDGLIFSAKKIYGINDYETRVSIYSSIVKNISKKFNRAFFVRESNDKMKTIFIITKRKIDNELKDFILRH